MQAVNNLLLGKDVQWSILDGVSRFHWLSGRESVAATTAALSLGWIDDAPITPVEIFIISSVRWNESIIVITRIQAPNWVIQRPVRVLARINFDTLTVHRFVISGARNTITSLIRTLQAVFSALGALVVLDVLTGGAFENPGFTTLTIVILIFPAVTAIARSMVRIKGALGAGAPFVFTSGAVLATVLTLVIEVDELSGSAFRNVCGTSHIIFIGDCALGTHAVHIVVGVEIKIFAHAHTASTSALAARLAVLSTRFTSVVPS